MKKILFIIILSVFIISACQTNIEKENIEIVTTIFPLSEFAKEVGGDKVKVTMLLPPGAEAHTYDPTPNDIIRVNRADMFIYIGEEMEPWAKRIINSLNNDIKIIEAIRYVNKIIEDEHHHHDDHNHGHDHSHENKLIEKIDHIIHEWEDNEITAEEAMHEIDELIHDYLKHENHDDHNHGHDHSHEYDPHIWLNFQNNIDIVNAIANYLSILDPENEDYFRNNANAYNNKLRALDQLYQDSLANCNNRLIISAGHNIFGYLEEKYNFESITVYGLSPDSEPTTATIRDIINLLEQNNINYIIFEEMINPRLAETIAKDTNAETLIFNPAENIPRSDEGKTFIAIMQSNLETLTRAMDCS